MANVIAFDESILWTIGGQDYQIKKPSIGAAADFIEKYKAVENDSKGQLDIMVSYLDSLGLPKDICVRLNSNQLEMIVESLAGKKKA
jgi:TRAP-type C4-dicarboxylate transport system substrate-binding protein